MEGMDFWFRFLLGGFVWTLIACVAIWTWHAVWCGRLTDRILAAVDWINGHRR